MSEFYILEIEPADSREFDLDRWAREINWYSMTFTNNGAVWQLRNEREMEFGTAFQRGNRIYLSWQYNSFGPRSCWLATQLAGELLCRGYKMSLGPCSPQCFTDAQAR